MPDNTETAAAQRTASPETEALLNRLRRIEGQIRGIHRMIEQDRVCEDIVTQLMAVRSSLDQVGLLIIDRHIDRCLAGRGDPAQALQELQQTLRLWLRFGGQPKAD